MSRWQANPEPYTYKKNNRQLAVTVILLFIITILAIHMQPLNAGQASLLADEYMEYIVQSGDTLWSIARSVRGQRQDIRDVVWEIQTVNEITPVIHPGQKLWVPMKGDK